MKRNLMLRMLILCTLLLTLPLGAMAQHSGQDVAPPTAEDNALAHRLAVVSEQTGLVASLTPFSAACTYDTAAELYLCRPATPKPIAPRNPQATAQAQHLLNTVGLLLIPDSTNDRIMAFDPQTGDLVDANFVPAEASIGTGIHALLSADGTRILLSDQTGDVVHQFNRETGQYLGIFAPAGGANLNIMDNIRGMAMLPNGHLLVTVSAGPNEDAIAEFDLTGNYVGNFVANGAGGMNNPFDVFARNHDWLVAAIDSDMIHRYNLGGGHIGDLTAINTFPEQMARTANGHLLVANFSPSSEEGVLEFTADGTFVGRYDPDGLGGYRGVYELPNGRILTTTGSGVYEIDRAGNLVDSKITGVSGRFIQYVPPLREPTLFCNDTSIQIPGSGTGASPAAPYPSEIVVSGLRALLDVKVHLLDMSHTWPHDIDILLVGPQGQNLIIMSDAGAVSPILNINLILDDEAAMVVPNSQITSGTYHPINYGVESDPFASPAPVPTAATELATFIGTNPNGTWQLYVMDDAAGDIGNMAGGWCLAITAEPLQPEIALLPTTLTPTVMMDTTVTATLTIHNHGDAELVWEVFDPVVPVVDATGGAPLGRVLAVASDTAADLVLSHPNAGHQTAVWRATQTAAAVLYDQTDQVGGDGFPSQTFEPSMAVYNSQGADDFIIPSADSYWLIQQVDVLGSRFNYDSPIPSVDVAMYANGDDFLPGTMVYTVTEVIPKENDTGDFEIILPTPAVLPVGHYWVSVIANAPYNPYGQWFWSTRAVQANHPYAWQNPNGGFGTACPTWQPGASVCHVGGGVQPDALFRLHGVVVNECTPLADMPWLSFAPHSGTISAGDSQALALTFDATGYATGVYTGSLCFVNNDPITPIAAVPITMTVLQAGVQLGPEATLSGLPSHTVTYTVPITNTGDTADTFHLTAGSHLWTTTFPASISLQTGEVGSFEVVVAIPAGTQPPANDMVIITATSQAGYNVAHSVTLTTYVLPLPNPVIYLPLIVR